MFVRGNGPVFCGGADLKERKGKSEQWVRERRLKAFAAYEALEALPMPCDRAGARRGASARASRSPAACDFIVATPDASFGTPEAQRGTVGATQRLPRILGKRLAKDLMFTGRALTRRGGARRGLRRAGRRSRPRRTQLADIADADPQGPPLGDARSPSAPSTAASSSTPKGALRGSRSRRSREQLASGKWHGQDPVRMDWKAQTLGEVLERQARERRRRRRSSRRSGRFTYRGPAICKARGAPRARMQALGIGRGDHVGILMGNDEKWLALFYGAALIGAVTVPVNTRFKAAEIDFCLKQADCKALFYVAALPQHRLRRHGARDRLRQRAFDITRALPERSIERHALGRAGGHRC